jgi:D-psicose/D-tagatose/L-ribulose 3-epimerase
MKRMPKFGLNLLLWTANVDESTWPLFDQVKSWGYDGVELPVFEVDERSLRAADRKLDDLPEKNSN